MKFSIRFLLALLVLGALLANFFAARQSADRIKSEKAKVIAEADQLVSKKREAVSFKSLYQTVLEGEKLLNEKYESSFEASKELPYLVSELIIKDPDLISYTRLPLLDEGKLNHIAFRIYIPKNQPVYLSTTFSNGGIAFNAPQDHLVQLSPGQHIVDFRYDYTDKSSLELFIDGEKVFSISTLGEQSGHSTSLNYFTTQRNLQDLKKPKRLFELEPSLDPKLANSERAFVRVFLQGAAGEE